jgi:hypothetical protein
VKYVSSFGHLADESEVRDRCGTRLWSVSSDTHTSINAAAYMRHRRIEEYAAETPYKVAINHVRRGSIRRFKRPPE